MGETVSKRQHGSRDLSAVCIAAANLVVHPVRGHGHAHYAFSIGSLTRNSEPRPDTLSTSIVPP